MVGAFITRDFRVGCLLIGVSLGLSLGPMARAQTRPTPSAAAPNRPPDSNQHDGDTRKAPAATSVVADSPVLTIRGLCAHLTQTDQPQSACQTIVTRAQFENLIDALHAGTDAQTKRHLAKAYPEFLIMAREAEQRGLDKQPRFEERLDFARLQILSQELVGQIEQEAAHVPEGDIEDYYKKNTADFESAVLERIVIPNRTQVKPQSNTAAAPGTAAEDSMTKEAELLRIQAAAGKDFADLQVQAYKAAGISGDNPAKPKLDKMRRRGLPPEHATVFDLKPGQVSPVISDATGLYIYKLDWKGTELLDAVRSEISNTLRAQRVRKMIQSLQQPYTTDINEGYFGADTSAESH